VVILLRVIRATLAIHAAFVTELGTPFIGELIDDIKGHSVPLAVVSEP
jgi:hypothetical protein